MQFAWEFQNIGKTCWCIYGKKTRNNQTQIKCLLFQKYSNVFESLGFSKIWKNVLPLDQMCCGPGPSFEDFCPGQKFKICDFYTVDKNIFTEWPCWAVPVSKIIVERRPCVAPGSELGLKLFAVPSGPGPRDLSPIGHIMRAALWGFVVPFIVFFLVVIHCSFCCLIQCSLPFSTLIIYCYGFLGAVGHLMAAAHWGCAFSFIVSFAFSYCFCCVLIHSSFCCLIHCSLPCSTQNVYFPLFSALGPGLGGSPGPS